MCRKSGGIAAVIVFVALFFSGSEAEAARRQQSVVFNMLQWDDLLPTDSAVSIVGDDPITARRGQIDDQHKIRREVMRLPGGRILYEARKSASVDINEPAEVELMRRWGSDNDVKGLGITLNRQSIRKVDNENGSIAILASESASFHCVFFFQYMADDLGKISLQSQALTGGQCLKAGSNEAEKIEPEFLNLLSRIRYDGGKYARSQLFSAGLAEAQRQEEQDDQAIAQDKTPPGLDVPAKLETDSPYVMIRGNATDNVELAEVRVSGRWAAINSEGKFVSKVTVPAGRSSIHVVAKDRAGNVTEKDVEITNSGQAAPQIAQVKQPHFGKYHALVIAEQHYLYLDSTMQLDTPIADGQLIGRVLEEKYGFDVRYMENATKEDILKALQEYTHNLRPEDNLLVYYAGHGIKDEDKGGKTGSGYWVPVDGTTSSSANWVPNRDIIKAFYRSKAGQVILVSDSCFSGTFTQDLDLTVQSTKKSINLAESLEFRSRTALSSGGLEPVIDSFSPTDKNSLFAMHFKTVLSQNSGTLSATQISVLIRGLVRKQTDQTPQYGAMLTAGHDDKGDFFFRKKQ